MWVILPFFLGFGQVSAYTGAIMGQQTPCDDGQTGINIDWDPKDYSQFTCPNDYQFVAQPDVDPVYFDLQAVNSSFNPRKDQVGHRCIDSALIYTDIPPLRGDHRPNWARYGEYLYVPPQRWLHNLEHGTIALLYHPCVNRVELDKLRQIVTGCLWRHVITPYNKLSQQRPLALVSWGAKLEMNVVDTENVVNFIRKHARNAPEDIERDGIYNQYLIQPARIVSDEKDNKICGTQ